MTQAENDGLEEKGEGIGAGVREADMIDGGKKEVTSGLGRVGEKESLDAQIAREVCSENPDALQRLFLQDSQHE